MKRPKVCILQMDGVNCDRETAYAVSLAHGDPKIVHINEFREKRYRLRDFPALILAGGFSYGDDVCSGKIAANEISTFLADDLSLCIERGGLLLGICNGFQILSQAGLLPRGKLGPMEGKLALNERGTFHHGVVELISLASPCLLTKGARVIELDVAHAEGRYKAEDEVIHTVEDNHLVVFRYSKAGQPTMEYPANPNGSTNAIAALCDPSGRIMGMMPHPERSVDWSHHPNWRRFSRTGKPHGLWIFENLVREASYL